MSGIKTKSTGPFAFFSPLATLVSLRSPIFCFRPASLGSLFAESFSCLQKVDHVTNYCKKKKKKKKKRLLFLKENFVIKECLTFFSQPLPAQPSVSGPMVSFLAALAEMAALAWPPFLPAVLALGSKYQQVTLVFLFSAVILIPP